MGVNVRNAYSQRVSPGLLLNFAWIGLCSLGGPYWPGQDLTLPDIIVMKISDFNYIFLSGVSAIMLGRDLI